MADRQKTNVLLLCSYISLTATNVMNSEGFQILFVTEDGENTPDQPDAFQMDGDNQNQSFFWTSNNTKILIDLYKKYKCKVGTMTIRNFKAMWERIATELSSVLGRQVLPKHCENRWKVLDRNYKKWVENNNSTGRGRKVFEFSEEMASVFEKKRNIAPLLLLSTDTEHEPEKINDESKDILENDKPTTSKMPTTSRGEEKRRTEVQKRKTVLQKIREDRLKYQKERLALLQKSTTEFLKLQLERNNILRERNRLEAKKLKCRNKKMP